MQEFHRRRQFIGTGSELHVYQERHRAVPWEKSDYRVSASAGMSAISRPSVRPSVCLSVRTSLSFFLRLSACLPVCRLSVVQHSTTSLHSHPLSKRSYVCMYVCTYVCMYVLTYVCRYICLSVCLSVCLSDCLSVWLFLSSLFLFFSSFFPLFFLFFSFSLLFL